MDIREEFFSTEGRLARMDYFQRNLALYFLSALVRYAAALQPGFAINLILTAILIILIVANLSLMARRLHDLDKSGWMAALIILPIVNIIFCLYLLLKKGTEGPNRYGPDPLEQQQ